MNVPHSLTLNYEYFPLIIRYYPIIIILSSVLHALYSLKTPPRAIWLKWLPLQPSLLQVLFHLHFVTFWNIPRVGAFRLLEYLRYRKVATRRELILNVLFFILIYSFVVLTGVRFIYAVLLYRYITHPQFLSTVKRPPLTRLAVEALHQLNSRILVYYFGNHWYSYVVVRCVF